jgi:thioredoxin reductase (NADPH)
MYIVSTLILLPLRAIILILKYASVLKKSSRTQSLNCPKVGILTVSHFYLKLTYLGIFAAGDVRSGSVKRFASGAGEGSIAIQFVHQYLKRM